MRDYLDTHSCFCELNHHLEWTRRTLTSPPRPERSTEHSDDAHLRAFAMEASASFLARSADALASGEIPPGSPRGIFVVGYAMYLVPSVYDVLTVPVAGRSEDEVDEHRASVRDRLAPVLPLAFPELRFRAFRLAGSISRVVHLDEDASQLEEWEAMGVLDGPYPGAIPAFGQLLTGCMVSVRGAVDADPSAPPLSLRKCAAVELLRPTVWRAFPRFAIETCAKLVARLAEEAGRVEELKMNDDARLSHGRFMAAAESLQMFADQRREDAPRDETIRMIGQLVAAAKNAEGKMRIVTIGVPPCKMKYKEVQMRTCTRLAMIFLPSCGGALPTRDAREILNQLYYEIGPTAKVQPTMEYLRRAADLALSHGGAPDDDVLEVENARHMFENYVVASVNDFAKRRDNARNPRQHAAGV